MRPRSRALGYLRQDILKVLLWTQRGPGRKPGRAGRVCLCPSVSAHTSGFLTLTLYGLRTFTCLLKNLWGSFIAFN